MSARTICMEAMAAAIPQMPGPEFCQSPLPEARVILELFPKPPPAPEQLEMVSIARDLRVRYANAMREVVIELDRDQVAAIANAVQAHKSGRKFYHRLGPAVEVMESIVRQWCSCSCRTGTGAGTGKQMISKG